MKKLIIFADGLDVDSGLTQFDTNSGDTPKPFKLMGSNMIGVHRAFRSVTNPTFGWGTTFTNDFMGCVPGRSDLMRPISLVCKVKSANGRPRSAERRGGKECVSTCRSRWWPYQYKK